MYIMLTYPILLYVIDKVLDYTESIISHVWYMFHGSTEEFPFYKNRLYYKIFISFRSNIIMKLHKHREMIKK